MDELEPLEGTELPGELDEFGNPVLKQEVPTEEMEPSFEDEEENLEEVEPEEEEL